ncbi:hypothetical protein [Paraburkholderia caribensis]|uniref:hypothetical protein n=1 Tax=Paraburkholderia caribensis TaxID=75105 RepID=UPI000A4D994D|nr:hypothetical protein [Paraburkholderia caribensis]CAG9213718.1 conserved hypothetical protein [Paraburkholderia caribensis]
MHHGLKIEMFGNNGQNVLSITVGTRQLHMDGHETERLIERLGFFRAAMRPGIATQMSPTHHYVIEINPSWHAEPHPNGDGLVVLLRHTGYGWTGFFIPHAQVPLLLDQFANFIATPVPIPMSAN